MKETNTRKGPDENAEESEDVERCIYMNIEESGYLHPRQESTREHEERPNIRDSSISTRDPKEIRALSPCELQTKKCINVESVSQNSQSEDGTSISSFTEEHNSESLKNIQSTTKTDETRSSAIKAKLESNVEGTSNVQHYYSGTGYSQTYPSGISGFTKRSQSNPADSQFARGEHEKIVAQTKASDIPHLYNPGGSIYYYNPQSEIGASEHRSTSPIGTLPMPYGMVNPSESASIYGGICSSQSYPLQGSNISRPMVIRTSTEPMWLYRMSTEEARHDSYTSFKSSMAQEMETTEKDPDQSDYTSPRTRSQYQQLKRSDRMDEDAYKQTSKKVNKVHSSAGRPKMNRKDYFCTKCNVKHTPQWRYFFNEPVCNACYMKLKKQLNLGSSTTSSDKWSQKPKR
ncbi:bifunctional Zinc finger [Babesia duncani]|uniref:Bifunctional Zinc finger n=1 Tax=Babesia duncani TaxID=323732 RepID=A0AAD9PLB6_9APIC|nr:bifunctional Zinc finger [Babesia duncani]